jgi:hypothetical protein
MAQIPSGGEARGTEYPTEEVAIMDQLLFHPKVVHLPVALAVLMPLVAGGLAVAWWRGWLAKRAWVVAVVLQAILVASGFVAMRTGEAEEERVEGVVAERFIEAHEEAAEVFVWAGVAVLALTLGAGVVRRERLARGLAVGATIGTLVVLGLGYRVGEAGGSLVYEHGAASAYTSPGPNGGAPRSPGDDDHDEGHEGGHEDD